MDYGPEREGLSGASNYNFYREDDAYDTSNSASIADPELIEMLQTDTYKNFTPNMDHIDPEANVRLIFHCLLSGCLLNLSILYLSV